MSPRRRLFRDLFISLVALCASFGGGWVAYRWQHASRMNVGIDFTKPFLIPIGYAPTTLPQTAETANFRPGDRIDILVEIDDVAEPLILDAVVTRKTAKQSFSLLLPAGGADLLELAIRLGLPLRYRPTVVVSDPVSFAATGREQIRSAHPAGQSAR